MRFILSLLFLNCIVLSGIAQRRYTINYSTRKASYDTLRSGVILMPMQLVIRDSLSYTYYPDIPIRPGLKNTVPLGSVYWPKSTFINTSSCIQIFPFGEFDKPKKQVLVVDSCRKGDWVIYDGTKDILGYKCTMAKGVSNGITIQAWFAPDLPVSFAPHFTTQLPGTILEYWYEGRDFIVTAVEIKREAVEIVEPKFCKRITRKEYDKLIQKRRGHY
jgi:hypothetical protein